MVRRLSAPPAAAGDVSLRERLLERYRARAERQYMGLDGRPLFYNSAAALIAAELEAGAAVVVPAHAVGRELASGARHVRVEPDGRVVPVRPVRDPADPMSFIGWEEI